SWTINEYSPDGEVQWYGLFSQCNRLKCISYYNMNFLVIFTSIISGIFLLFTAICIFLMGIHNFFRRYYYITPCFAFIGVLLLFFSLVFYAHYALINGVSIRLIIAAIAMAFSCLGIITFIGGRYSIFY